MHIALERGFEEGEMEWGGGTAAFCAACRDKRMYV